MSELNCFPGYNSVEEYSKAALQAALSCAKASNEMDLDLYDYYNTFKGFREGMAKERAMLLSLITKLIPGQKVQEHFEQLDVDEQMDFLKDVNSSILENVSYLLDETDGEKKPEIELVATSKPRISINTSWNRKSFDAIKNSSKAYSLLSAKNIARPQFAFKDKVDNRNSIFVPVIKEKPNSIRPLAVILEKDDVGEETFCHPYECELEKLEPLPEQLQLSEPMLPKPLEETPLEYVETTESLNALCNELKEQKEFAIDIEHHSYRSFQGFSCLLQISTREKDYIIDGLALRSDLWSLNEVFTDPKIIKVLHGGDMDIIWLQRDFGLYIVNMFDTGQAARVLNFAHLSLAYLMKHYCNIELNKQFQLADWRIRPLPEELLKYARQDTHYLLYIFDCMKNELLKKGNELKNLLLSVYQRSKEICLKKYKKLVFSDDKYLELYKKSRKIFNPRQLFCLKELYAWRDKIARLEDESYGYVLPNHMLLQISEVLPREQQGILACCNPVPPLVQQHLNDLFAIVSKANNSSLAQLQEPQNKVQSAEINASVDLNNMLHCPHDIHSYDDTRMHLHNFSENTNSVLYDIKEVRVPMKEKTALIFHRGTKIEEENTVSKETAEEVADMIKKDNKTSYERYMLTLKYRAAVGPDDGDTPSTEKEKQSKAFIAQQPICENSPILENTAHIETVSIKKPSDENDVEENATVKEEPAVREEASNLKGKKRRKRKKFNNEVPTPGGSSSHDHPPRKKSKTPDTSLNHDSSSFQPFDYSKTDYNSVKNSSGKKKHKKPSFKPNKGVQNFKTPGRNNRKKKGRGKQASFNTNKNRTNSGGKNWPKI